MIIDLFLNTTGNQLVFKIAITNDTYFVFRSSWRNIIKEIIGANIIILVDIFHSRMVKRINFYSSAIFIYRNVSLLSQFIGFSFLFG